MELTNRLHQVMLHESTAGGGHGAVVTAISRPLGHVLQYDRPRTLLAF